MMSCCGLTPHVSLRAGPPPQILLPRLLHRQRAQTNRAQGKALVDSSLAENQDLNCSFAKQERLLDAVRSAVS